MQLKKQESQRRPEPKLVHVGFGKSPPHSSLLCLKWLPRAVSDLFPFAVTIQESPCKSMGNPEKQSAQQSTEKQEEAR